MDLELLKKYWEGKCSDEETARVEGFLRENPEEADHLLRNEWNRAAATISEKDSLAIREAVFATVNTDKDKTDKPKRFSLSGMKKPLMIAASVILFIAAGTSVYLLQEDRAAHWTVINNVKHKTREVQLEDGTKIWLKPGSSISYSDRFGEEERYIKLQGEAYFDVAEDSLKPFKVLTDNITTRVLGTMFNIKAYAFEEHIQIILTEGSVKVTLKDEDEEREIARMRPGELLNFDKVNNNTSIDSIRNSKEDLYKGNKLVFYNTTIEEALTKISRVYRIPVDMNDLSATDRKKHVSGVFHNTSPVDAMQKILFIHHMKLEQGEGKLLVKKKQQ